MKWLEVHGYLAAWLSTLIAAIGLVIQNTRAERTETNWPRAMVYIAFLTFLAVLVTPDSSPVARGVGVVLVGGAFWKFLEHFNTNKE